MVRECIVPGATHARPTRTPNTPISPRGRYGSTEGLSSRTCTAKCPTGKYNDRLGARTEDDCFDCPPGRYGDTEGLTTEDCSGWCPSGTYNAYAGLTTADECVDCPTGYRGWQCDGDGHHFDVDQAPRRGYWDSTDGNINENSHAYIKSDAGLSCFASFDLPLNILLTILPFFPPSHGSAGPDSGHIQSFLHTTGESGRLRPELRARSCCGLRRFCITVCVILSWRNPVPRPRDPRSRTDF